MKTKENSKISIQSITLIIGKKSLSISIDDARKLYLALGDVFKERVRIGYLPYSYPYPYKNIPIWMNASSDSLLNLNQNAQENLDLQKMQIHLSNSTLREVKNK